MQCRVQGFNTRISAFPIARSCVCLQVVSGARTYDDQKYPVEEDIKSIETLAIRGPVEVVGGSHTIQKG